MLSAAAGLVLEDQLMYYMFGIISIHSSTDHIVVKSSDNNAFESDIGLTGEQSPSNIKEI